VNGVQAQALDAELTALQGQVKQLRAENARLLRLLELTPQQARPPAQLARVGTELQVMAQVSDSSATIATSAIRS
jgi:prefoldin subunit 5